MQVKQKDITHIKKELRTFRSKLVGETLFDNELYEALIEVIQCFPKSVLVKHINKEVKKTIGEVKVKNLKAFLKKGK